MKKILLMICVGLSALLQAQQSVSGIISDPHGQPIKNVNIAAPEIHKETTSDENGRYLLNGLPLGNLKLHLSCLGFAPQNKSIHIIEGLQELNFTLEEKAFQMDEIIVSTAFNKLQSQNVMKVEHASMRSLQEKGTATLIEGLATIPGVSQVSTGTSIGKPVIRGLSGNRVLVYSQGVRIENQQFGDEHGLGLNDAGVESVEVIKGPASLLYGSDALGGVLYFNPEKFAQPNTFKTNFSQKFFSNTLGSNSSLGLKTSTEHWKFSARGSYNMHSDYQVPGGDRVTNTRFNESDLKAGVGYSNTKFSSVFRYNFNNLDLGIPEEGITAQTQSKKTALPRQAVKNHLLSWNNIVYFQNTKLDLDLGYIDNDRSEFEDSSDPSLHMKLRTLNYDAKFHLPKFGNTEAIVGIQGMNQTNVNSGEEYLIPDAATNDFGVFGTFNYSWKSNVIQAGLRYDHRKIDTEANGIPGDEGSFEAISKNYDSFNAAIGYKTDLQQNLSLRLNVASGFRAPNLAELTSNGVHEGTNRYEIGNSNLKTEQNVQTDINLEYHSEHFEFFANGFYNHINNYIYAAPAGTVIEDNAVFDYVQSNASLYGGELGFHIHPHPLDWLHLESSFENVTGKKQNGDALPLIPANAWSNTIRTEFNIQKWLTEGFATFNLMHTFSQNKVSGFETRTKDYTLVNLGFGGKVKWGKNSFDLNLNANNLLDKNYIAHLSRLKTDGIPNIGRTIVLGVNFTI